MMTTLYRKVLAINITNQSTLFVFESFWDITPYVLGDNLHLAPISTPYCMRPTSLNHVCIILLGI